MRGMRLRLAFTLLAATAAGGCMSLWEQRRQQTVVWSDHSDLTVEVWVIQGWGGSPLFLPLDILATPLLIVFVETPFALDAARSDEHRIAGGVFGYLLSWLPVFTCMPMDNHNTLGLELGQRLEVTAEDREQLQHASAGESVELYVAWCQRQWGDRYPYLAKNIRENVRQVRVGPPAKAATGGSVPSTDPGHRL
jgi:hypothetical protein